MKRSPLRTVSAKRRRENAARKAVRHAVFERDGYTCRLAGLGVGECFGPLTPHHILKASQGGPYIEDNLAALCAYHNDAIEASAEVALRAAAVGLVRRHSQGG